MWEMWKIGSSLDGSGSFTRTSFSSTGWGRQKMAVTHENTQTESNYKYPVCVCECVLQVYTSWAAHCSCCWTVCRAQLRWTVSLRKLKAGSRWRGTPTAPCCSLLCAAEEMIKCIIISRICEQQTMNSSGLRVLGKLGGSLLEDVLGKMFSLYILKANLYIWIKMLLVIKHYICFIWLVHQALKVSLWILKLEKAKLKHKKLLPDSDSVLVLLTLPLCRSFLGPKQLVRELKTKFCKKKKKS